MKLLQIGNPHPRNAEFIRRACTLFQIEYHQTESYTPPDEGYDIIWAPIGWIHPDAYPHSKILFGPHFFVFPDPSYPLFTKATAEHAKRCAYTCLSDWNVAVHKEFIPQEKQIIPFVALPFGIGDIQPKEPSTSYDYDCIVYFKNRHPSLLAACKSILDAKGLRSKVYIYGSYQRQEYLDTLKRVRFAVWIGSHESQGFGFQECLATNTPIYVYDVKSMKDEYNGHFLYAHHKEQLLASSGSYWSDVCGKKVYTQEEFAGRLDEFIAAIPTYTPAAYIQEIMSDRACFQRILDHFEPTKANALPIHFTGFWSGFHERTNPVHEGFFLKLFEEVYGCPVRAGSFEESTILVENTQVQHSRRTEKQWLHTYVYSGESYLRGDASRYTCVLYGQRNHDNYVNVPLYLAYIVCSHSQSFIESNHSGTRTDVPSKDVLAVISNGGGGIRNEFCDALERAGISVTYAGHYRNNTGGAFQPQYNTQEFRDYVKQFKFIMSMENSEEDTYITEKITHGLLAGSVPIYWGSPSVSTYFNSKRFIEVTDRDAAVARIKTMTDAEWLSMVNERPFTDAGQRYTIQQVASHIRNSIMPRPYPLLNQTFIICNPAYEPERYRQCRAMCTSLGVSDDSVTFLCPTYKHTISPELAAKYIKNDLVKRLRPNGTKRGELSLTLNWRSVLETIVQQYKGGIFLILESDTYVLPGIVDLNKCLEHLSTKQWDAINIGSGLDQGGDPLQRLSHIEGPTPYRDRPNTSLFDSQPSEDISKSGDPNRFIRKFMTRCTDAHLFSYEGCKKLLAHMQNDENYGAPFDYYLINKTEQDMNFKYYWSTIAYFDQRSNRGLDRSTLQGDLS